MLPKPYYERDGATIWHGNCLEVMPALDADSVDSIVTDPPYGLSFMGKDWDHGVPGEHFWREALRVAKPGAHLLAFGGTRTYHRLACAIEDAGWEIRDTLMWLYGSGFPKSRDVGKAIDSEAGAVRVPMTVAKPGDLFESEREVVARYDGATNIGRKIDGKMGYSPGTDYPDVDRAVTITAPATDAARQWSGWGTALKPAYESIILARKPLDGTVAANTLKHGCGGLNIDGCRIATDETGERNHNGAVYEGVADGYKRPNKSSYTHKTDWKMQPAGRWPANLILSHAPGCNGECVEGCPVKMLDEQSGRLTSGVFKRRGSKSSTFLAHTRNADVAGCQGGDTGGASRFFYCPKASKRDRDEGLEGFDEVVRAVGPEGHRLNKTAKSGELQRFPRRNTHPTVKPTALMRYLCRLVTPPGGIVLDPFMGSGSTGKACAAEGFRFIGIELDEGYCKIASARVAQASVDRGLFGAETATI